MMALPAPQDPTVPTPPSSELVSLPPEASTLSAIRRAALRMVAECDEDTLAAVVEVLEAHGVDTYQRATDEILKDEPDCCPTP